MFGWKVEVSDKSGIFPASRHFYLASNNRRGKYIKKGQGLDREIFPTRLQARLAIKLFLTIFGKEQVNELYFKILTVKL